MSKEIKIPQISEGVDTATIAEILVAEGDTVEKDQSLITVESDKASVEIPSTAAGKIKSIKISEGDEVNVGDVIVVLEASGAEDDDEDADEAEDKNEDEDEDDSSGASTEEEDNDEKDSSEKKEKKAAKKSEDDNDESAEEDDEKSGQKKKKSAKKEEAGDDNEDEEKDSDDEGDSKEKEEKDDNDDDDDFKEAESDEADKKSKPKKPKKDQPVPASPGVRKLARELGVDLTGIKGSGADGRISDADVKTASKSGEKSQSRGSGNLPDFSQWGETETKKLSGIRKTTGKKVTQAWQEIPHVFQFEEADITDIQQYMDENQEKAEKAGGKLTITAILTKITADALQRFPKFNASLDLKNEQMILKKYINIGIAVNTEKGLLMPVIKNVDKKGMIELAVELSEVAEKAREGKLKGEEMQGGNFSISNLGGIGGTNFTPIIYAPQSAILGVSRAQTKPVYHENKVALREILPLSLSYDHRLIDGAEAAEFITWLKLALEDPFKALLG